MRDHDDGRVHAGHDSRQHRQQMRRPEHQGSSSAVLSSFPGSAGWQRQLTSWTKIKDKFGLHDSRYDEFEYLLYMDINDAFVENYVNYTLCFI